LTAARAVESALALLGAGIESPRMARSTVENLRLSDRRVLSARRWRGHGEQPTTVFLHGLLDSAQGWARLCEGMRGQRIAFDLPGFGSSDAPARGSIAGYARDVAEGLTALGIERYTLVGHSLGGAVATALAELEPASVAALVLLAPAGFGRIHLAEAASIPGVRNLVQLGLPMALSSRLAVTAGYMTMVTNGASPDRGLVERVTTRGRELVDGAREGTRAVVEAGRAKDAFHRRRIDYHGPVFAVWGDRDRLVPLSHRAGVRAAFPHAHIHTWSGMGHHPLRERLEDLIELLGHARGAALRPQAPRAASSLADAA
jgi:pimeloyl-ACP methyl ester carboxylesterase